MQRAKELSEKIGLKDACAALGVPRSSLYRAQKPRPIAVRTSPRAFSAAEKDKVLEALNSPRFQDLAPREVYATLLDEGQYLSSWRTMYRVLDENGEIRERRDQLRHPNYTKPELLATAPKQLWSWDITKLLGAAKWTYFYLYVILDVYSRYVVGWMIAERESADLAEDLIAQTCTRQGIERGQLTLHADRGSAMTSKTVAMLLADLGVTKTHSRPHVSNDNPYSEAHFKTMKYHHNYPARFGSLQDARAWASTFFDWYNNRHHHTGIALLTPVDVHLDRAQSVLQKRQAVLQAAYERHPERFVRGCSKPAALPAAAWINPPAPQATAVPKNENENSHSQSAVPVSLGGRSFYQYPVYQKSLPFGSD